MAEHDRHYRCASGVHALELAVLGTHRGLPRESSARHQEMCNVRESTVCPHSPTHPHTQCTTAAQQLELTRGCCRRAHAARHAAVACVRAVGGTKSLHVALRLKYVAVQTAAVLAVVEAHEMATQGVGKRRCAMSYVGLPRVNEIDINSDNRAKRIRKRQ